MVFDSYVVLIVVETPNPGSTCSLNGAFNLALEDTLVCRPYALV
jgi:hypothetical protein